MQVAGSPQPWPEISLRHVQGLKSVSENWVLLKFSTCWKDNDILGHHMIEHTIFNEHNSDIILWYYIVLIQTLKEASLT